MFDKTKPMTLGDIFSQTFNLVKITFSRNLIIAISILLPVGIIMAYGIQEFFSSFFEAFKNREELDSGNVNYDNVLMLMTSMMWYTFSITLFYLGVLAAKIGITHIGYGAMEDEKITVNQAFKKIFSVTFLRSIGMYLLQILAYAAIFFVAFIILMIALAVDFILLKVLGVLAIIAAVIIVFYLNFSWHFTLVAIAGADKRVFESFSKSALLVTNNWWRVFGIVILISIIVQFAVSVVSTPVSFILMWDFISQYLSAAAKGTMDTQDPTAMFGMMKSFGLSIGLIIMFSSLIEALIIPLFDVVFYFDLRIRKNDFDTPLTTDNTLGEGNPAIE